MPPSSGRAAFVTGGTGFVGLNLVKELMIRGWDVTALHRRSSELKLLKRFHPRLAAGNLSEPNSLLAAIPPDTDTIFHVAGNTNMWRGGNVQQTKDNVEGTRNIVDAALAKRVRRLVVTSSISAYGMVDGEISEETPSLAAESRVNYQKTKWQAQELARAAMTKGLEVVIMQPGAIMGPYDIGTWSRLFVMVRDGKLPGVPPSLLSFTHVREVVAAHIAAADKGQNGGCYLLGGENKTMMELVREISALVGKPAPKKETSMLLLRTIASFADLASRFSRKAPPITPEMASLMSRKVSTSSLKAQRELGYRVLPLKLMVKDCYDWMAMEGRI
ncbi:MAG TPA: NAD-dependent epimerase/dehydratase family protein [Steroidobacteraceae bacterium]|jgi:nucleoside-diphosphate-sugar epimerase|nr:NAD-dependent epimerase/dehydratase family protein [Steroidobacteraceae bacterium]